MVYLIYVLLTPTLLRRSVKAMPLFSYKRDVLPVRSLRILTTLCYGDFLDLSKDFVKMFLVLECIQDSKECHLDPSHCNL